VKALRVLEEGGRAELIGSGEGAGVKFL